MMVAALMALSLGSYFVRKKPAPKREPTPAELAARMLPDMSNVKIETNRDVDVMEVHIDRSGAAALTGTVRNNTNHEIRTAEIVFDLTDSSGSQLGGVSQRLENLVPQKSLNFRLPIDQQDARFVLVREVRTR
ncbi:MAG: FxLYD domain-containing protein [Acidobacteriia bacterium]|nr:FxLYD domain-containing protein [Terriglobia bacterium]